MNAIPQGRLKNVCTFVRRNTDMGYQNLAQRKPVGASCGWVQQELLAGAPYRWRRPSSGQGCLPSKVRVGWIGSYPGPGSDYGTFHYIGFSIGGASDPCFTGQGAGFCSLASGVAGSYIDTTSSVANLDIYKALADGAWSSSYSFTLRMVGTYSAYTYTPYIQVLGGSGATILGPTAYAGNGVYPPVCPASGYSDSTVTFYDDGRITIV